MIENIGVAKPTGDTVFVTLENPLQEKIKTKAGVEIYLPSWLNIEQYASVQGWVHSVGDRSNLGLKEGEEVALSYHLVAAHDTINGSVVYHNCHRIGEELVWKAESFMVMAVKRDGEWEAVGDWVLMKEVKSPPKYNTFLVLPEFLDSQPRKGAAEFVSGDVPVSKGDIVLFNESFRSTYTLPDSTEFIILNKEYIDAYEQV